MDFASLFQKSSSSTEVDKSATGLSSLFSDVAKQKFARTFKPVEFQPNEKEVVEEPEPEMDERLKAKREKRKMRNMKSSEEMKKTNNSTSVAKSEKPETENDTNDKSEDVSPPVEVSKEEKDERTIFVGNVPISFTAEKLSKLFSTYGTVESVRLRSVPVSGAKVDKAGDQDLVRKVCVNAKKFGEQKGSVNAYIVYKDKASVAEALKANNMLVEKRHLRVDKANPSLFDPKRTVFVGGLPFYADEEEIREYFATKLPNGQDDIDGIRIIRDHETLVGKGIGYILLKSRELVMQALTLNDTTYKKRWTLRVSSCGKRTKRSHDESKDTTNTTTNNNDNNNTENKEEDEGEKSEPKKKKQRKEISETSMQAMKRIRTKTVMTKKKLLQSRQKGGNTNNGNNKKQKQKSNNKPKPSKKK